MSANVRTIIRNFIPAVASRGVNQISSYIDTILASFLPSGAIAALAYAQTIYLIPVSLFGMSISSAELPEMSSQIGPQQDVAKALRERLNTSAQRVGFFIIPAVAGFLALGDSIVALIYQTGSFARSDVRYVWLVLAGSTVGLLAATLGRLYTSAFWALRDTRTPLRYAALRVLLTACLGWLLAFPVPRWLGIPAELGLVGLTIASGSAAWIEFTLLRVAMNSRIGRTGLNASYLVKLWGAAAGAVVIAFIIKLWANSLSPLISGALVLSVYGIIYLGMAAMIGLPEAAKAFHTLRRLIVKNAR